MRHLLDLMGLLDLASTREARAVSAPAPIMLPEAIKQEEVAQHRNIWCTEYDACLDEALHNAWRSWTCRQCGRFVLRGEVRSRVVAHEAARQPTT